MKMQKQTIIIFLIALLILSIIINGLIINKLNFENTLYFNRLYDKDKIINMWEERATNQLKLISNYCDEMKDVYSLIVFNMSDCEIYTTKESIQNVICERNNALFVQQN